jgi:hypothetical protein
MTILAIIAARFALDLPVNVPSDAPAFAYHWAWIGLAVVAGYYVAMAVVLRWRPQRRVSVTRYEPPLGISPAVAAYLFENGRCERAFAAALVSLAAKGYIRIVQKEDSFRLTRLRESDSALPPEELYALAEVFPSGLETYQFDAHTGNSDLSRVYKGFEITVESIAVPKLISPRLGFWLAGLAVASPAVVQVLALFPARDDHTSLMILYPVLWIVLGGFCLVAALRAWPATLRKLATLLPGSRRPACPPDLIDLTPFFLTTTAALAFGYLAFLSSPQFAVLVTSAVILGASTHNLLESPTRAGRRLLAELSGFREFLARADADRLNRENKPGHTPRVLEKYSGFAMALSVEKGWGEVFTSDLLQLLQFDRAYSVTPPEISLPDLPSRDNGIIQLNLGSRK